MPSSPQLAAQLIAPECSKACGVEFDRCHEHQMRLSARNASEEWLARGSAFLYCRADLEDLTPSLREAGCLVRARQPAPAPAHRVYTESHARAPSAPLPLVPLLPQPHANTAALMSSASLTTSLLGARQPGCQDTPKMKQMRSYVSVAESFHRQMSTRHSMASAAKSPPPVAFLYLPFPAHRMHTLSPLLAVALFVRTHTRLSRSRGAGSGPRRGKPSHTTRCH